MIKKLILLSIFILLLTACSQLKKQTNIDNSPNTDSFYSEQEYIFQLAEIHDANYPTSLADKRFAELVYNRTKGKIRIDVYTGGILGEESDVIEQLQYGTIAFARVSIAPMAEFSETLNALMMPYLYNDADHMWKVLNSPLGVHMLDSISAAGMLGLAWYDSGARSFYTKEKVETLDDLSGLKIRVQTSSLMFAMCEALDAIPKTLAENEIYEAIKSGNIDGAENNIPTYESFKQYEVCKYFILDEHTRIPEILTGSEVALESLTKDDMDIIRECAKETQEYEREQWILAENTARENLEAAGVTFIQLSADVKEEFLDACDSLYDEFGADYKDIIDEIRSIGDKTK